MMDEKGRLFGKINIVDLLVLVIVIVAVVVLGIKFLGGGGLGAGGGGRTLTYTVVTPAVRQEVYDNIQDYIPGGIGKDQLMASGELLDGFVTSVTAKPHVQSFSLDPLNGALVVPLDESTLDLTFTIQVKVTNNITNEVGTQEVRTGKQHIVKTQHFEIPNGTIIKCEWSDEKPEQPKT